MPSSVHNHQNLSAKILPSALHLKNIPGNAKKKTYSDYSTDCGVIRTTKFCLL